MFASNKLKEEYWINFSVSEEDIEFIYNLLLEKEIPLSNEVLLRSLINFRIGQEKDNSEKQSQGKNDIYLPRNEYDIGDKLTFPSLDMKIGEIQDIRR